MNLPKRSQFTVRDPLRFGMSSVSMIWLLACVSAGLWIMLGRSAPNPSVAAMPADVQPASLVADGVAAVAKYRPIEQVRVGQRVMTPGTGAGV
jgi:hypothetical protein